MLTEAEIPGVFLVAGKVFRDPRGWFQEIWNPARLGGRPGLPASFVQDNISVSLPGVLRGLHYQHPNAQGKLVSVLTGTILDVAVDIRVGSPTFGRWIGVELSAGDGRQIYLPEGCAHGFLVVGDEAATVLYKCTAGYDPGGEWGVRWDDPRLEIAWGVKDPILSDKDRRAPLLSEVPPDRLPQYRPAGS
jgi:dTDP-4-dehydrorhamnose 3,5-epimerase